MNIIIYDYSKLRGKIKKVFGTQNSFASAMGISSVTVSSKLNNKNYFEQPEMLRAGSILGIPKEKLHEYSLVKNLSGEKE